MSHPFDRIKLRREELGMTQSDLAGILNYADRSSIAKIEKGVNDITQAKIEAFAEALHTTPAFLMGWTDDSYDYDKDEDSRSAEIPIEIYEHLMETNDDDFERVWKLWTEMDADTTDELPDNRNIIPIPRMNKVPLLGTIACGVPILAEQNVEDDVDLPEHIHADFALRCKGDSMINARIFDGDIVYIRKQETVENGEIAAVLIDNEATLKRVQLFPDHITLEPENPLIRPISIWGEEMNTVCILGKAVAFTSCVR